MLIAAMIIGGLSFVMSTAALIWLIAKEMSSHSIQYVQTPDFPAGDPNLDKLSRKIFSEYQDLEFRGDEEIPAKQPLKKQ